MGSFSEENRNTAMQRKREINPHKTLISLLFSLHMHFFCFSVKNHGIFPGAVNRIGPGIMYFSEKLRRIGKPSMEKSMSGILNRDRIGNKSHRKRENKSFFIENSLHRSDCFGFLWL